MFGVSDGFVFAFNSCTVLLNVEDLFWNSSASLSLDTPAVLHAVKALDAGRGFFLGLLTKGTV